MSLTFAFRRAIGDDPGLWIRLATRMLSTSLVVAAAVLCGGALVAVCYYFLWDWTMRFVVHRVIAPEHHKNAPDRIIGRECEIRKQDNALMVRFDGDLWPCRCSYEVQDGDRVRVVRVEDGVLIVAPINSEEN